MKNSNDFKSSVEEIEFVLSENDNVLSRTSSGMGVDVSVSVRKRELLGDAINVSSENVRSNRNMVARYMLSRSILNDFTPSDACVVLFAIAEIVNFETGGKAVFRDWSVEYGGVQSTHISDSLFEDVCNRVAECFAMSNTSDGMDWKILAASLEWTIGVGPLHPFIDGCGRISRCISTFISYKYHIDRPIYPSRESYYSLENNKIENFIKYYLECNKYCWMY